MTARTLQFVVPLGACKLCWQHQLLSDLGTCARCSLPYVITTMLSQLHRERVLLLSIVRRAGLVDEEASKVVARFDGVLGDEGRLI